MNKLIQSNLVGFLFLLLSAYSLNAQVICNAPPANDFCRDAFEIDGTLLGNTCCGEIEGFNLCEQNAGLSLESGVWYFYDQDFSATLLEIENLNIEGGIGVEIYAGSCGSLTLLAKSDCTGFEERNFTVPNCNGRIYIHVATTNDGCGEFVVAMTDIIGCESADNCEEVTSNLQMSPISDETQECVSSCLEYSCISSCTNQSAWFEFNTDQFATIATLAVNADFNFNVSVYRATNCSDLDDLISCTTYSSGEYFDVAVVPSSTYFVEVSLIDGTPGAIDICVTTAQDFIDCSFGDINIIRNEFPNANPNGPFCPGETIEICFDLTFKVDLPNQGNGCQWLQGIVPVFGGGWDMAAQLPNNQTPDNNWEWNENVLYNVDSPVLGLGLDQNNNPIIEYGTGGLSTNDPIPGGWWYSTPAPPSSGCPTDGTPDNSWGYNLTPCGGTTIINHCFMMTAKSHQQITDCDNEFDTDLSINIFTFADGETGCYPGELACAGDTPITFEGKIDCSALVEYELGTDEICSGDFASVPVSIMGGYEIPIRVDVLDAGNTTGAKSWEFLTGSGLIPDQIINNGTSIETITYEVSFHEPITACPTPVQTFQVLVHPEFTIPTFPPAVLCEGDSETFEAPAGHDTYQWFDAVKDSLLSEDQQFEISEPGFYRLEVTEDFCTAKQIIEVSTVEPLPLAVNVQELTVCNNFIGNLPTAVNLEALQLNGITGSWYNDSNSLINSPDNVDFNGNPAGIYNFSFTTEAANAPCPDTTYMLAITVNECVCPNVEILPFDNLCALDNTIDLNDFRSSIEAGVWTITNGPDVSSLQISNAELIISPLTIAGEYTLRFTTNTTGVGAPCELFSETTFMVFEQPEISITPFGQACNFFSGTDPEMIDLDDFNETNVSGIWSTTETGVSIDSDNVVNFQGVDIADYVFTFTSDIAQSPCTNPFNTTTITVRDCTCPSVALGLLDNLCLAAQDVDLSVVKVTTEDGSWSVTDGPDVGSISINGNSMSILETTVPGEYELTFTLANIPTGSNCQESEAISFSIFEMPNADITPVGQACNEDNGSDPDFLDLDDFNVNSVSGEWTTTATNISIDGDNVVDFKGADIQDYTFTFTTNTAQIPCDEFVGTTVITLNNCTCPSVDIMPLDNLCIEQSSIDLNLLKVTTEPGTWAIIDGPNASSLNIVGAQLNIEDSSESGLYTVQFTLTETGLPPACPTTSEFQFELIQKPVADITQQTTVCNEDNGAEPDFVDLDDLNVNAVAGSWQSTDGLTIDGDNIVRFTGLNVQNYEFTFTTATAVAPCPEEDFLVTITVKDCSCPALVLQPADNFCQDDQMFNLDNLITDAEAGTWTIVGGVGNIPTIQNQMLVILDDSEPGDYMLTYTLDDQSGPANCPIFSEIPFTINTQPEAVIIDAAEVCNNFIGSLPTEVNLDTMFVSGSAGDWVSTDATITVDNNIIDFTNADAGVYEFIYTTNTAVEPCVDVPYSTFITVNECVCPTIELTSIDPLCAVDNSIDLSTLLGASDPGEWTITASSASTLPELFNQSQVIINESTEAGNYILTYTLTESNIPALCATSADIVFEVIGQPNAVILPAALACNVDDSPAASDILDLDDIFQSGDSGEWSTNESISINNDNSVSFNGEQPGDYLFVYTTNTAQSPCVDNEYELVITVENCICPPLAFSSTPTLCNDDTSIDLNTLLLNGVGAGTWDQTDGPVINGINGASEFLVNMIPEGEYQFEYTLTDVVPAGCDMTDVVSITINSTPELIVTPDIIVCNQSSSQAPNCIDLNTLMSGDDGSWIAPPSYTGDFSDIGNVCFDGVAGGTQFLFSYTTNTAVAPCINKTESIQVSVIDCSCPNVDVNDPPALCSSGDMINLSDLETTGTVPGSWSFISGPETVSIGNTEIFDASGFTAGMYIFQFTPNDTPEAMCPQMSQVEVEVVAPLSAGTGNTVDFCQDTDVQLNLFSLLDNADQGGSWTEVSAVNSAGQAFDASGGTFDMMGQLPGTYEFEYEHTGFEPCPDAKALITIIILENPIADAGETMVLTCAEMSFKLGGPNLSMGPRLVYEWTELSGISIDDPTAANPTIFEAGTYKVVVTDIIFGCQTEDEVIITEEVGFPTFDTEILPFDCENNSGGVIVVQNSTGGNGDYVYTIDGGQTWTEDATFDALAPGVYTVTLRDGNGCEATVTGLEINDKIELNLDLGDDVEITFGENYYPLQVQTSALPSEIDSVIWTEDGEIICEGDYDSCSIIEVDPEDVTTYCVRVVDINGCEETDCVVIREVLEVNVYIANVFTPEIDDFNNRFFVQTDENINSVKSMRIFDRWGSQVFEGETDHSPNDPSYGWDGRWQNALVEEGVYTYHIVVLDALNSEHSFAGTVTLIR